MSESAFTDLPCVSCPDPWVCGESGCCGEVEALRATRDRALSYESPRYAEKKAEALQRLRHAIEQVEKDQHLNAQGAMADALRASQACFGVIRHGEDVR